MHAQRGAMLLDTLIAASIFLVVLAALIGPTTLGIRKGLPNLADAAVSDLLDNEIVRIDDALKYASNSLQPVTVATSAPLPVGTPLPITLKLSLTTALDGSTLVTVSANYFSDGVHRQLSRTSTVPPGVPLPGSTLRAAPVPPPTGAP